jgi:hypothetical protein
MDLKIRLHPCKSAVNALDCPASSASLILATPTAATPILATPTAATPTAATPTAVTPNAAIQIAATPTAATPNAAIQIAATPILVTPNAATPTAATQFAARALARNAAYSFRVDQPWESRVVATPAQVGSPAPAESREQAVLCVAPVHCAALTRSLADSSRVSRLLLILQAK